MCTTLNHVQNTIACFYEDQQEVTDHSPSDLRIETSSDRSLFRLFVVQVRRFMRCTGSLPANEYPADQLDTEYLFCVEEYDRCIRENSKYNPPRSRDKEIVMVLSSKIAVKFHVDRFQADQLGTGIARAPSKIMRVIFIFFCKLKLV